MSTRIDIIRAKADFDEHVGQHKCSLRLVAIARGETPCAERLPLLRAWMGAAARWGIEPGDPARVREQYAGQTALLGQRVTA